MSRRGWLTGTVFLVGAGLLVGATIFGFAESQRQVPGPKSGRTLLHNGWSISPAGRPTELVGDMPGTIVSLPGGEYLAVNTCGYHDHSLSIVEASTGKIKQVFNLGESFVGMAYSEARGELLLSGGGSHDRNKGRDDKQFGEPIPDTSRGTVLRFRWNGQKLEPLPGITWKNDDGKRSFVSEIRSDGKDGFYIADTQQDQLVHLSGPSLETVRKVKVGYHPYGLALKADGTSIAVSIWGDQKVVELDRETLKLRTETPVGPHPTSVVYGRDGRLFVANAGENTVSIVKGGKVVETVLVSVDGDKVIGTTPVALAIRGDRLIAANADNNCLAIIDIPVGGPTELVGFIPTGRYPAAVHPTEAAIWVGTAKGLRDEPNVEPADVEKFIQSGKSLDADTRGGAIPFTYVGKLLKGHLTSIPYPDAKKLAEYTAQVKANLPSGQTALSKTEASRIARSVLPKIKHVIYVIKENRTYDQVFGDLPQGNGDPRLTLFPERVTPNQHALARRHVLLDNLYCDGEVSQVGHQWTDAGYANDYCEKNWTINYSGRGEIESDTRMFTSPAGYLWQHAKRHGKTTRIYGEYLEWQEDHDAAKGEVKADPEKFGASKEWEDLFAADEADTKKVDVFLKEMRAAEKTGKWPNLMVLALPWDHTHGLSPGAHTPNAMVADNDLAVGRLVEGVSKSKFWKETAIFVIQDDAQAGGDHVDAHRTIGQVISPYTKLGVVDSTQYTTCSMLRTMEMILGLPPLTQYTKRATPMLACFRGKLDVTPYQAIVPGIDLNKKNPSSGTLATRSMRLDWSERDKANPYELNSILWAHLRPGEPEPVPVVGKLRR